MSKDEHISEKLIRLYPELYSDCFDFSFGFGWNKIVEDMSKRLSSVVKKIKKELEKDKLAWCVKCGEIKSEHSEEKTCKEFLPAYPRVDQIKEKFGYLNVYLSDTTPEIDKIVTEAMSESRHVCELCGLPAEIRIGLGHIQTLCDGHFMERLVQQYEYEKNEK